jgi:hypothetical protein
MLIWQLKMNTPQVNGTIVELIAQVKHPQSYGIIRAVKVEITKTDKIVLAVVSGDGSIAFIESGDRVTLEGGNKSYGDIRAKYRVVKIMGISLPRLTEKRFEKARV